MVEIFVDPQGNAQEVTPILRQCAAEEPDVFKILTCSEEDLNLYNNGYICVDGMPKLRETGFIKEEVVEPQGELAADMAYVYEALASLTEAMASLQEGEE